MQGSSFDRGVEQLQERVEELRRQAEQDPARIAELLPSVMAELATALEELRVAHEELLQRQEEVVESPGAEQAARARHEDLFQSAPDAYLVTDLHGRIREANAAAAALLNVQQEALAGKSLSVYVPLPDRREFRAELASLVEGGRRGNWKIRLKPRGKPAVTAIVSVAPERDMGGNAVGLRWIMRDITQRRQAERERERLLTELESQRALLESVFQQMAAGVIVADASGRIISVNKYAAEIRRLAGLPADALDVFADFPLLRLDGRRLVPDDFPLFRALRHGEVTVAEEIDYQRADGSSGTLSASAAPVRDSEGRIIHGVVTFADITERKRAQEELAQAHQRLQWVMDALPVGVAVAHDPKCRVITVNPAGAAMFGAEVGENVSQSALNSERPEYLHYQECRLLEPQELPLQRAVTENREIRGVELEIAAPSGRRRQVRVNAAPVRDLDGEVVGGIAVLADITEQRRILELERARAHEARLRAIALEDAATGVALLDMDFNFLEVNPAYCEQVRTPRERLLGQKYFSILPDRDLELTFQTVRDTGEPIAVKEFAYRFAYQPERGVTYWNWSLSPVKDDDELVYGLVLTLEEVTEQVQARQRIERAERERAAEANILNAVLDNSRPFMAYLDRDLRFVWANAGYARAGGLSPRDFVGRTHWEMWRDAPRLAALERVRETGKPEEGHEQPIHIPRTGEARYTDWMIAPVKDLSGEVVGLVLSVMDVTEQVRARQRMAEAERLLDALVENTSTHLAYLDRDFNFVRVNEAYAKGSGRTREELIGRNHFGLFPDPENEAIFRRVRDTGEPAEYFEKPFEYADQPERGVTYWHWTLTPEKNQAGEVQGLAFSLTDVTEDVRLRERLVAAERARTQMAETLAMEVNHRMKNNLAMVAGLLQLQVSDHTEESPSAIIVRSAIGRLMAVAAVHEQLYETKSEYVNVVDCVRHIARANAEALMPRRPIELLVEGEPIEYPSKSGSVVCVIANELITNAIKYGGAGEDGKLVIRATVGTRNGEFRLSVWNSGQPVPESFDPFEKRTMGLRLVHGLAKEQYGGSLSVRPEAGGTTAEVVLDEARLREPARESGAPSA